MNGTLRAGDVTLHTDDPSAVLRDILARYKSQRLPGLPTFTGGLVGYFSYDYLGYREPKARTDAQDTENFKDVDLMLFDKVNAFDNLRQKIILIANMPLDAVQTNYNKATRELQQMADLLRHGTKKQEPPGKLLGEFTPLFDRAAYCAMVERARHHIYEGNIFQIVLSDRLSAPFDLYQGDSKYRRGKLSAKNFGMEDNKKLYRCTLHFACDNRTPWQNLYAGALAEWLPATFFLSFQKMVVK